MRSLIKLGSLKSSYFLIVVFSFILKSGVAQQDLRSFVIPDSLKGLGYIEIYNRFAKSYKDTTTSVLYINTYIKKGIDDEDMIKKARGYTFLSRYQKDAELKLQYLDSAISLSKNLTNEYFPAFPYSIKGKFYYDRLNFKKALDAFFESLKYAKRNNSTYYKYAAKRNIALIKNKLGKYDEALKGFKECLDYCYLPKIGIKDSTSYLLIVADIAETYQNMGRIDSSSVYIQKGLELSKYVPEYDFYQYFVFRSGIDQYYLQNYKAALDSLQKSAYAASNMLNENNVLEAYLFSAKIFDKLAAPEQAIQYYQKIDSVYQQSGKVSSEVREAYNALLKRYKENKDTENQLVYIEKLLQFDSILQQDYKELNEILVKKYDTPQLLEEKQQLIDVANNKNSTYSIYIIVLIIIAGLLVVLFGYQFYRRRRFQERFEALLAQKNTDSERQKEDKVSEKKVSDEEIGISSTIVQEVLEKLAVFEDQHEFLSSKVTLTQLSSELGTNNKYLSKIINTYKEKSFSQYINDLRIDYVVELLQSDKKIRSYTIKAIAREVGFNSAEVFSRTFYAKHGIYPSYFIKKLGSHK